jgi:hypothetical protein
MQGKREKTRKRRGKKKETGKEKGKPIKNGLEMRKSAKNISLAGPFQPVLIPSTTIPWRFFTSFLVKE